MAGEPLLLDETVRRKLDSLSLVARHVRAGVMKGDRRSRKRGTSVEFADYRNYVPGDDLRRLDWNVYARSDRSVIKLMEDEEDLAVHIIVDASASMDFPNDIDGAEFNKLLFAKRLAAGLAYVSLGENDRLTISTLVDADGFGPSRGRQHTVRMLRYLHEVKGHGETDLDGLLSDYAAKAARPGLLFLISDMFSTSGFATGLGKLAGRGYEIVVVHVLSPDEVEPTVAGDLRLVDSETGNAQEVSLDPGLLALYRQRLEQWQADIRAECMRRGAVYVTACTDQPWERIVLQDFRRAGVVR
ncbi:MAG: DUF58 domain-containing protein [Chloroflexi bacterium]|nr:DUF58 domain-containing protein [Chloroflexota bacterium]